MPPDWQLSTWITDLVGNNKVIDGMMEIVASNYFAPRVAIILLICLWLGTREFARREHNQKIIMSIGVGVALSFIIAEFLCFIQDHAGDFWARPYDNHQEARDAMSLLFFKLPDSSFPSNAMCGIAPIATGLWFVDRRVSIGAWGLVLLWGFGRVYVGIHYPMDIAGGILIGIISFFVARKLVLALDPWFTWLLRLARRLYLA